VFSGRIKGKHRELMTPIITCMETLGQAYGI